ncbi:hypothetical protein LX16_1276 [Stackebrandtia albiflava]|uniref:Uncharacterized protein n=1 Tax=Stackebrandtia albiflava TaxID=406432 RepID=A0A562VCF2_9ACTN|nr:hypothetical protein [Stackebrandtia albiflava]TWJ15565.1 hypothetical protein LX16_1276 [Stackebrandtia albiflava]
MTVTATAPGLWFRDFLLKRAAVRRMPVSSTGAPATDAGLPVYEDATRS